MCSAVTKPTDMCSAVAKPKDMCSAVTKPTDISLNGQVIDNHFAVWTIRPTVFIADGHLAENHKTDSRPTYTTSFAQSIKS